MHGRFNSKKEIQEYKVVVKYSVYGVKYEKKAEGFNDKNTALDWARKQITSSETDITINLKSYTL